MVRLPLYFIKQGLKESYKLFFFELARYNEFFVRMIPFRPMTADFNITDNCNSRCIACTCWKQKSHNELTTEEVNEILIQVKKIGIRSIGFAVGELLLRKDLPQLIKKTNDLNFDSICMVTNGLLSTLKRQIDDLKIGDKILFTCPLYGRDKLEAYVDADVYVLPSIYEIFGITVLEACACGTPVIITDRCGIADLVDGKIGYVVEYDRDQLQDAIVKTLSDGGLRRRFGEDRRRLVMEEFGWDKVVLDVEKIYLSVIER